MAPEPLLRQREAARILAVSESGVRRRVERGELPVVRIGRSIRFRLEDVEALIEKGMATRGPEPPNDNGAPRQARRVNDAAEASGGTSTAVRTGRHGAR